MCADTIEEWKDVVGYEGLYLVSSIGRVKKLASVTMRNNGRPLPRKERILSEKVDKDGYLNVTLRKNNKGRMFRLHRLVAHAFISDPHGYQINHINEIKDDNRVENIEVVTARENTTYSTSKKMTGAYKYNPPDHVSTKWVSRISIEGRQLHLGYYETELEAHEAYLVALDKHGIVNKYASVL